MIRASAVLSFSVLLGGCLSGMNTWDTVTKTSSTIKFGDGAAHVISLMGAPIQTEMNGSCTVYKYCSSAMVNDAFTYVLLRDNKVQSVLNRQGRVGGLCYEFFQQTDWNQTLSGNYLNLLPQTPSYSPPASSSSFSRAMADSLEETNRANNQMYNSLIESMGEQQRALQPQRFQTNCMMIGNMMSCN